MRTERHKKPPLPTPAEMRLLQALWALKEATKEEVANYFPATEQPHYKTTPALLRIMDGQMKGKGVISYTASGKVLIFKPVVGEHEMAKASVMTLLTHNFGGSGRGLLINLVECDTLQGRELREIEGLICKYWESKEEGDLNA